MLERVSPSAECAAHIFLRQFEAPVRSHRSLDPAFWKHGTGLIDVPAWWPSYLDTIRSRSQFAAFEPNVKSTSSVPPSIPRYHGSKSMRPAVRSITHSSFCNQVATSQADLDNATDALDHDCQTAASFQYMNETLRETRQLDIEPAKVGKQKVTESIRKQSLEREQAWQDFVRAGWNKRHAAKLIQKLALGNNHNDLERSLRAFDFIPRDERTAQDYHTIVDVSIRLNRYSAAIRTIKEAVSRKLSYETFFEFLAICISKGLWNTAADLWREVGHAEYNDLKFATHDSAHQRKNIAGKFTSHFDIVHDLPAKLTVLANRLKDNDPVLMSRKYYLFDLVKNLISTTVESDKVMRIITRDGLLSLFSLQEELKLDSQLHFAALATINRLSEKGLRSQLALLIYQDFKSRYSGAFVPRWVFGTMVMICSSGKQPSMIYRSLLDDYESMYKNRDDEFYYQVMKACANQGEAEDVQTVFTKFLRHSRPRCANDLNPLIRVHAVMGECNKAQSEFDKVFAVYGFPHSTKNWNALLLAYSRANRGKEAYAKFEEMQQTSVVPDSYSWSIMVAIATKRGDSVYASKLVKRAEANGISPPLAMIGAIVDSYLLNDQVDEAWALVVRVTRQATEIAESPIRLWNSLLRYYAFRSNSEAILRVQRAMKEFEIIADSMTYAALMTALVVQHRTEEAVQILRTLHFSQTLHANEFHYSILIHGFAMEKKAEMASVLYREMLERFPRPSPSARLSMLYLQAIRAEEKARSAYLSGKSPLKPDFRPMLDAIQEMLAETRSTDLASTTPSPGFGRKSPRTDLASTYLGSLITHLQRNNAYVPSANIVRMLSDKKDMLPNQALSANSSWIDSIERLERDMINATASKDWTVTQSLWNQIYDISFENCTPIDVVNQNLQTSSSERQQSQDTQVVDNQGSSDSSIVFRPFSADIMQNSSAHVLPAYKYILSRPFSQYIKTLEKQRKYTAILETVQKLRSHGFSLSSKNWNGVIQSLCRSTNAHEWTVAYELFERHFAVNAPSWDVIRRGQWVHPSEERPRNEWDLILRKKDRRKSRKTIEKANPGFLMPSYYTMVHLAIVWLNVTRSSAQGDHTLKRRLEEGTPRTVKIVLQTPYIRDRVQGVLLRGQQIVGDRLKRPRYHQSNSDFAGVQGSQLLIDRIPKDDLVKLKSKFSANTTPVTKADLCLAEELTGQVERSPIILPSEGRMESLRETRSRVLKAEQQKMQILRDMVQQIREDTYAPPLLVETMKRGAPSITQQVTTFTQPLSSEASEDEILFSVSNQDGLASQEHLAARSRNSKAIRLRRVRNILRVVSKSYLHEPSSLKARKQKKSIRTDALLKRQGIRLSLATSKESNNVAIPRRPRNRNKRPSARFVSELDETKGLDLQGRYGHEQRLRRLVERYTSSYYTLKAQLTARVAASKRSMRRLKWYKDNAQRATKRLRSTELRNSRHIPQHSEMVFDSN